MKNLLAKKTVTEKLAEAIAKIAYELVMIFLGLLALIGRLLYTFRKWEWRLAVAGFILYSAYTTFPFFAQAPKAQAALDGTKVMITHPDMQAREITLSLARIKWGEQDAEALDQLITHESGWDPAAINPNSGACGLFQNINCNYASMSLEDQIQWGFNYFAQHGYGTPSKAWLFWQTPHLIEGKMVHYY